LHPAENMTDRAIMPNIMPALMVNVVVERRIGYLRFGATKLLNIN
jgi:hypothetical protein